METPFYKRKIFIRIARIVLWLAILASARMVFAQSVTILPSGITPNQSGAIARLSYDAIMTLQNPQNGDVVYDVTFDCLRLYKRTKWVRVADLSDQKKPAMIAWKAGGTKVDVGQAVATDASGNVYIAGYFQESAQFDDTQLTESVTNKTSMFIAKYTSTGHILWVKKVGYGDAFNVDAMSVDTNGNIYLAGYFYVDATFGEVNLTSAGAKDIFLAKFTSDGTFEWVRKSGGPLDDEANDVAVDSLGNVYIVGYFSNTANLGGGTYTANGNLDMFMMKYTSNGSFLWLRIAGGSSIDSATAIVIDNSGKITITGYYYNTVTFGNKSFTSNGNGDIFLAQYDMSGNFKWAKSYGGIYGENGVDLALDSNKFIYLLCRFSGNIDELGLTSKGGDDVLFIKFADTGSLQWLRTAGGTGNDSGRSIDIDAGGNVYIAGDFSGNPGFGSATLDGSEGANIFVAKYTTDGGFQWAQEIGGKGEERSYKMAVDAQGNAYVTGSFANSFTYGDNSFTTTGQYDMFVLRVRD